MSWESCLDCRQPYFASDPWQQLCIKCWKTSKAYNLTKGDEAFVKAQARIVELEAELQSARDEAKLLEAALADEKKREKPLGRARLSPRQIKVLLSLCHPDKHSNSKKAQEVTRWLLQQR